MEVLKIMAFFFLFCTERVLCLINMTTYKNLPPLYQFEDYDKCLKYNADHGTYCVVYAEIVPDYSVPLWLEIEKFSADHKKHYRHDHLFFGVCLERCKKVSFLDDSQGGNLISVDIADKEIQTYYTDVYDSIDETTLHDRQNYTNLIKNCLNHDFMSTYNLSLRIFVEYCEKSNGVFKWDIWYTVFVTLVSGIAVLVFFSSLCDYVLKKMQPIGHQKDEFYKLRLHYTFHALLTSFSICRNYYRLNRAPSNKIEQELKFLDGVRTVCMFFVIMAHVLVVFMVIHVQNPDFFEQYFYRVEISIFENGNVILQTFFFMSGFLLYVNFKSRAVITVTSECRECFKSYFQLIFLRFLRLMPSIALLLLFTTSLQSHLQDGPFWRHLTETERRFCRDYWWKSLFLLNNAVDMRKNCLHHTWYIATDLQLFGIFLLVAIIVSKYEKFKKTVFSTLLLTSIIVPALATYIQSLDAFFISNPETYRYLYFKDAPTIYGSYLPFYTNMGGYLMGFITANIFLKLRAQKRDFNYMKLNLLWWLLFPLGFGLLFSGYYFMANDFEKPSYWEAIYAGLFRNVWSILMGIFILGLCFNVGWIGYDFLSLSFFRLLGRISYQCYIWHTVVIRVLMGHFRAPVHVNHLFLISSLIAALMLTYLVAYFVALFWEYPLAEIIRCTLMGKKDERKRNQETGEIFVLSDQQHVPRH